jgi:hypothetical protein
MFDFISTFCKFKDIKEIKFTKVKDSIFKITIESDIEINDRNLDDSEFVAQLCKIDPTLELKMSTEYTYIPFDGQMVACQCFNIPINVQLLCNKQLNKFFDIKLTK